MVRFVDAEEIVRYRTKVSLWIKASEELPEVGDIVFAVARHKSSCVWFATKARLGKTGWIELPDANPVEVSYWMAIPPLPPETEEDEENDGNML